MRTEVRTPSGARIALCDDTLTAHRTALADELRHAPPRLCYAAAHLVLRPGTDASARPPAAPLDPESIDWETTLALRTRIDGFGIGIAEAMDTAQRFEIGWPAAERLIRETAGLGLKSGWVAGVSSDHAPDATALDAIAPAVVHQARLVQELGGIPVILPIAALPRAGAGPDEYVRVYDALLSELDSPVFLHWLGPMFLAELEGYFPGDSLERILTRHAERVNGLKLSLLDAQLERDLRRSLAARGQLLLTGDDFHFGELVLGGDAPSDGAEVGAPAVTGAIDIAGRSVPTGDFSHALLGVLDAVAEPFRLALAYLARGDAAGYRALIEPCERLGQWIFQAPTEQYKAGLAVLAWLNGLQHDYRLVNELERARSPEHYAHLAELASEAGALLDAALAAERLERLFADFAQPDR